MKRLLSILAVVIAACASGSNNDGRDAPFPVFEPVPGAHFGLTLVERDGTAISGIDVVFHGPDGDLLGRAVTSSEGTVLANVPDGSTVTYLYVDAVGFSILQTIADIRRGEHITRVVEVLPAAHLGDAQIGLAGQLAGATGYQLSIGCDRGNVVGSSVAFPVDSHCDADRDGSLTLIETATGAGSQLVGFSVLENVSIAQVFAAPVQLPAWRDDFVFFTASVAGTTSGDVAVLQLVGDGTLFPFLVPSPPGSTTAKLIRTASPDVYRRSFEQIGDAYRDVVRRGAIVTTNETLDFSVAMPAVEAVAFDGSCLTLTPESAPSGADALTFRGTWQPGTLHRWYLEAPPQANGFCFPVLPDDLASWMPTAKDSITIISGWVDYDVYGGWDEMRTSSVRDLLGGRTTTRRFVRFGS